MKKIFSLVSLAVLALTVGCSEDQTSDTPNLKQGMLRASTEASTRTALDGTKVVWSTDDKLGVVTADAPGTIRQYTLSSEAGKPTGEFTGDALTGTDEVYAFYPYDAAITCTDGAFNFTLPATQKFTANSFANNVFPMVSKSASTDAMGFRNLMGVLMFQTSGNQAVASLTVTTAGEPIAGAASVAMDYTGAPELVMNASSTTSITLTEVHTTLTATPVAFYIALPAGEYAAGMTFELKDANDAVIWSKTTTKPLTITRSQVTPLTPVYAAHFPDAKFRAYLVTKGFVETADKTDIDMDNEANIAKFAETTKIDYRDKRITSLKGIEYFTALTYLDCAYNPLKTLDVTQNTALTKLYCSSNQLTTLDVTQNTALTYLDCSSNQLTALDVTQNTELTTFFCTDNQLTTLDISANKSIANLLCGKQTSDGTTAQGLTLLCNQTQFDGNLGTGTDNEDVTKKLKESNFPDAAFRAYLVTELGFVETADKTDIDMGNKANSAKFAETTEIDCSDNQITSLKGIEYFTALTYLDCDYNQLTALDMTQNTALTTLYCSSNQLAALDVTQNTALTFLNCYSNQLSSLVVTQNAALIDLYCDSNQLTALDVTKNTALKYLACTYNQLTSLVVTQNTALKELSCTNNPLTALDVTQNTALRRLNCSYNQLTSLDVTQNTALIELDCANNQLTALDVTQNTELTYLACGYNQLTTLDISANKLIINLYCGRQTSDGTTAQGLTLSCNQAQLDGNLGTGANNTGVTKELKK